MKPVAIAADLQTVARLLEGVVLLLDGLTDKILDDERKPTPPKPRTRRPRR